MTRKKPANLLPGSNGSSSKPEETPEQKKARRIRLLERIQTQGLEFDLTNDEIEAGYGDEDEWNLRPPHSSP